MPLISGSSFYLSVQNLHISEVSSIRNNQGNFIKPEGHYKLDATYIKYPLDVNKRTAFISKYFVFQSKLWLEWKALCIIKKEHGLVVCLFYLKHQKLP